MPEIFLSDYFYGDESGQFRYFRIPTLLITSPHFKYVSTDAKLLYGMLLDRMSLSARNNWYDKDGRVYICPNHKLLKLNTLHRSASGLYWLYLADKRDCQCCPLREKCLNEQDRRGARKLEHSYFMPQRKNNLERQNEPAYQEALMKRQIWCEGTFATQKWSHNLTRLL